MSPSPSCSIIFQFSGKVLVLISLFTFFQFYQFVGSFFFTITRSGRLAKIRWSVCIPKSQRGLCVSFFYDGFWVVLIPFVRMVKFKLLAQFLEDHLLIRVVSRFILFLRYFPAFANYVIDRFVCITKWSTFTILLHFIYSCFGIVLTMFFCDAFRRDSFLSLKVSLS